jgi:hypothetical protein
VVTNMQAIGRARFRELAHRVVGGIEVSLLWRQLDDALAVRVVELGPGAGFEFRVRPEDALEAFDHPYVYRPVQAVPPLELLAA